MQFTVAGIVLSRSCLVSKWHGVQMPAPPPLATLANAALTWSGTCHCFPEWHNFPVYHTSPILHSLLYIGTTGAENNNDNDDNDNDNKTAFYQSGTANL